MGYVEGWILRWYRDKLIRIIVAGFQATSFRELKPVVFGGIGIPHIKLSLQEVTPSKKAPAVAFCVAHRPVKANLRGMI